MKNRIVGIYIRVSKEEQAKEGYSIPAQKSRLIAFCNAMGWKNYKFYIDPGVSAKDMKRPKLQLLLDDVKSGRISTVLVYRLDRFTRKVKDLHRMLEILEANNCAFKSATEPYDTSTAMGKLFITIVGALAEWESDNLSERTRMGLEEKVAGGERVGNIPYGFDLDENEKLVKNEKAPIVIDIFEKYEKGWSMTRIANYLRYRVPEKNWYPNTVRRILTNPAYYGATRWNDKVFENTHEGYISKERWLKIQERIKSQSKTFRKDVKSIYLFQGKIVCYNCGHILSVNRFFRKKKDGTEYETIIYKCQRCLRNKQKVFQPGEEHFENALIEYMKTFTLENIELPEEKEKNEIKSFQQQLKKIEEQRKKYQRAWAADLMTDEEFEELMNETRTEYEELERKIKQKTGSRVINPEEIKKIVFTFKEIYTNLIKEEKRDFIQTFIKEIHYRAIPQPPKDPRNKKGKPKVVITDIVFY